MSRWHRQRSKGIGHSQLMTAGIMLIGLMASPFAIDLPLYFTAQNQLQTAVDAAALAGAYMLPEGEFEAEDAAVDIGSENLVLGQELEAGDFNFDSDGNTFTVSATKQVPTITSRLICGLQGAFQTGDGVEAPEGGEQGEGEGEAGGNEEGFSSSHFCA